MTEPLFCIITVTYNNLGGLQKTQKSITAQTCKDYKWIVIDGGSHDGTVDFLQTTDAQFISEPDEGIYDAMNKGLDRTVGRYVVFMNAGDQFAAPDTLKYISDNLHAHDFPDFLYGPAYEERSECDPAHKPAIQIKFLYWGMVTHHQSMLYKSNKINRLRYNPQYNIAGDYDFTCQFLSRTKSVHMTQKPLCLFEAGGVSQQSVVQGRKEQFTIRRDLKICTPLFNHLIYAMQFMTMTLRHKAPRLYWFLRARFRT